MIGENWSRFEGRDCGEQVVGWEVSVQGFASDRSQQGAAGCGVLGLDQAEVEEFVNSEVKCETR